MLYTVAQIENWIRLIAAARANDDGLAVVLQELMQVGASLKVTKSGSLKLGAGAMSAEAYEAVKVAKLTPQEAILSRLLTGARRQDHPWLEAVTAAYTDLCTRCEKGMKRLTTAASKGDTKTWAAALPDLIDRHYQAGLLALVLWNAGVAEYEAALREHDETYSERQQDAIEAGVAHTALIPDGPPRAWPVETPDGWIWVCDANTHEGQPWTPPGIPGKSWIDGELLVTADELAAGLIRLEPAGAEQREAG